METPDALLFFQLRDPSQVSGEYRSAETLNLWAGASPWWFPTVGPAENNWFGSEGVPPSQDDLRRFAAIASVAGARGPLMTPRELRSDGGTRVAFSAARDFGDLTLQNRKDKNGDDLRAALIGLRFAKRLLSAIARQQL